MERSQTTKVLIHRSLTEEIMLGGVPRNMAILNGTVGAAIGVGGGSFILIPIFISIHLLLALLHKNDPLFLVCLKRFFYTSYFKRYYET